MNGESFVYRYTPSVCVSYLQEVGGQHGVSVAVVEGQGGGEAGHGDPLLDALTHSPPPGGLGAPQNAQVTSRALSHMHSHVHAVAV